MDEIQGSSVYDRATKEDLFGEKAEDVTTNTEEFTLPNGKVIVVRGLSRMEFLIGQKGARADDQAAQERWNLSKAIIDPVLTEADIETWQRKSGPMILNDIAMVVNRLSGIGRGADKEAYKSARE